MQRAIRGVQIDNDKAIASRYFELQLSSGVGKGIFTVPQKDRTTFEACEFTQRKHKIHFVHSDSHGRRAFSKPL